MRILILSLILTITIIGCVSKPISQENQKMENNMTSTEIPSSDNITKDKIRNHLNGTEIIYYDFRGKQVTYTIKEKDIKSIEKTIMEDRIVWKVRIGKGLAWDFFFDEQGNEIILKEQLFVT